MPLYTYLQGCALKSLATIIGLLPCVLARTTTCSHLHCSKEKKRKDFLRFFNLFPMQIGFLLYSILFSIDGLIGEIHIDNEIGKPTPLLAFSKRILNNKNKNKF
jgi:hypothetical protein